MEEGDCIMVLYSAADRLAKAEPLLENDDGNS
jgi:hypothetical protein